MEYFFLGMWIFFHITLKFENLLVYKTQNILI